MRTAIDVGAELTQLAPARNAIVAHATEWGVPIDASILALLVTEVLVNAMEHGAPPITAVIDWDGHRLRVEVSDGSHELPVHRWPAAGDRDGRGIWLVDRNASAWGVDANPGGKSVWFELASCPVP